MSSNAPITIVMNAGSGRNDADDKHEAITQAMAGSPRPYRLLVVTGSDLPAVAASAAAQAQGEGGVLVACGGDGTLSAVAGAAWRRDVPFGILPQGTFNYFGRRYGIPADLPEAMAILLDAREQPVQLGLVNDIPFLVNASLGLYPELLEDREAYKQRFGRSRLVALFSGLVTLLREHRELALAIQYEGGERVLRTPTLVVGNNALQLEQIGVDRAPLERDELVAMTVRRVGTLEMYGLMLRGALSRLGEAEEVISFGFREMRVRVGRRGRGRAHVKVAMDGEIHRLSTPLVFAVAPRPLRFLAPRPAPEPGQEPAA